MRKNKKYHWFMIAAKLATETQFGNITHYIGCTKRLVSKYDIKEAVLVMAAKFDVDPTRLIPVSVSYLGYMTEDTFEGE